MRIALLPDEYLPSGTRVHAKMFHELAVALKNNGHQPVVITPGTPSQKARLVIDYVDNVIAETYQMPVIVYTHPRTKKRVDAMGVQFNSLIKLLKPLGFKDYNKLQVSSKAVLSDSGTINEESSIMNFPALNLREAHERPEGMEEAAVIMTGLGVKRIMQGLTILEPQARDEERLIRQVYDYSMPNVSDKVVRIIHSYTDYVNRVVWKKY